MQMPLAAGEKRSKKRAKTEQKGSKRERGKKEEGSNVLRRVDHNSRRQLMEMLSVGALAASSGSRMLRFAASLVSSNSLRRALSGLLTSAPGFASPRGLQEREQCTLIRGKRYLHPPPPYYIRYLLAVGSPPLPPTRAAPRRAVARHYCHVWENVLKIIPKYGKTTNRSLGENIGPGGHPEIT